MNINSNKRKLSIDSTDNSSKKLCTKHSNDSPNELTQSLKLIDEFDSYESSDYRNDYPRNLIKLMYQLDLSVFYLLRKLTYEDKYPSLQIFSSIPELQNFKDIILCYKDQYICVQIENVDKYYIGSNITYNNLFNKSRQPFSINNYFNNLMKSLIFNSNNLLNQIKYFIVYTNSELDLTKDNEFKQTSNTNFYPFKCINVKEKRNELLMDCVLFNKSDIHNFVQFSQDEKNREELLKRLELIPAIKQKIKENNDLQISESELKWKFLDKLVFAVNQPDRAKLKDIIKNEIKLDKKYKYVKLQKKISSILASEKLGSKIIYEFNVLISILHDMFCHEKISSINLVSNKKANIIMVNYKEKRTYINVHETSHNIKYSQLFSSRDDGEFSINKYFLFFIEELRKGENIKFLVLFTNANLDLEEGRRLKKRMSVNYCPLDFDCINMQKKRFKVLKYCSCINKNSLYQFTWDETTKKKLFNLLKLPSFLQNERNSGCFSNDNVKALKEKFLHKIVIAVNQPCKKNLNTIIVDTVRNQGKTEEIQYNYEELHEIALRWLENCTSRSITKEIMYKIHSDIRNNRLSYHKIQYKDFIDEINIAKCIVGNASTYVFNEFLDFLVKGDGRKYIEVFKKNKIRLSSISSILNNAGTASVKVFQNLYKTLFDENGNQTQYLKVLKENKINFSTLCAMLSISRSTAVDAFKNLFHLWFDNEGNKTHILKIMNENNMKVASFSGMIFKSGCHAAKAFKDLFDLLFEKNGNETKILKNLKDNEINLCTISNIISGSRSHAAKAFKDLYDLLFDDNGNKTQILETLNKHKIKLSNISGILCGSGSDAAKTFKNIFELWFDENGNKRYYLKILEEKGINLSSIVDVLQFCKFKATSAFKSFYDLLIDANGNETKYLKTLKKYDIKISSIANILRQTNTRAAKAFTELYNLWFDENGNKTKYLVSFEKNGIKLTTIANVISTAKWNGAKAYKDLYEVFFDDKGNKSQRFKTLQENGVQLNIVFRILEASGSKAVKAFLNLYNLWFDINGNKTQCLMRLEEKGINLANVINLLSGSESSTRSALKKLYNL